MGLTGILDVCPCFRADQAIAVGCSRTMSRVQRNELTPARSWNCFLLLHFLSNMLCRQTMSNYQPCMYKISIVSLNRNLYVHLKAVTAIPVLCSN